MEKIEWQELTPTQRAQNQLRTSLLYLQGEHGDCGHETCELCNWMTETEKELAGIVQSPNQITIDTGKAQVVVNRRGGIIEGTYLCSSPAAALLFIWNQWYKDDADAYDLQPIKKAIDAGELSDATDLLNDFQDWRELRWDFWPADFIS